MKKIIYIFLIFIFVNCNDENANNCFQTAGEIIQVEVELPVFDKVVVHARIELIITEGPVQKIIIESGKNLLPDITAEVVNSELILTNNNTCNFVRDYNITKIYVTSPNLTQIRNASEFNVSSNGVLTYPSLYLQSAGQENDYLAIGDWHLNIENENVKIWGNGIAVFYLEGTTNNLDLSFSDGDTRYNGENFKAEHIKIKQVSSNDMLIYPVQSLTGTIHSTGNVISYNKPPIVEVEALSNYGKLIFK